LKNNVLWAIVLIIIFIYLSQSNDISPVTKQPNSTENTPLANLIDADVTFTGVDKYVGGTSLLSNELVRIFRLNGAREDLGTKSLNSGTLAVTPNVNYKFYFFMNSSVPSTNFYVDVMDYTAKVQESVDNLVGKGCSIDTTPKISVRNPDGAVQTSRSNAYTLGASESADFEVSISSHTDKCYGTPNAPKKNVVCFGYDASDFTNIKTNTNWVTPPRSILDLSRNSDQDSLKCYNFNLLENGVKDTLTVELTTNGNPAHNISIFTDDIGFDLHKNTLAEIWDYTDETGNQLARVINATPDGFIYLS